MEVPRHWRLKKQRYALAGQVCNHCDARIFPPRAVCPYCGSGSGLAVGQPQAQAALAVAQASQTVAR